MRLKIFLSIIALITVSLGWLAARAKGARLNADLLAARDRQRELATLQAENARLHAQTPDASRVSAANRVIAEVAALQHEITRREEAPRPAPFSTGEWTSAAAWSNRGMQTPRAALETALWAAAGGDVGGFLSVLEIDEAARAKANELLAKLPPESRHAFPNAESLVASVTLGRIPLAEAQIAWFHAIDDDHANAALLLHGAENLPPASIRPPGVDDDPTNAPPTSRENSGTRLTTLSLHRSNSGWRLVVPAPAIDRMGRDLLVSTK
jgi:hypothetical protein